MSLHVQWSPVALAAAYTVEVTGSDGGVDFSRTYATDQPASAHVAIRNASGTFMFTVVATDIIGHTHAR